MHMKKFLFLIILAMATITMACNNPLQIEDINGEDDYSLAVLTEKELLSKKTNKCLEQSVTHRNDNEVDFSCKRFSGVHDLITFNLKSEKEYVFLVDSKILSGNGDFYIIKDGQLIEKIGWTNEEEIKLKISGKISFRIAGESANLKVKVKKIN